MNELIDNAMMNIGAFFIIAGGFLLVAGVFGVLLHFVANIWITLSNKFRRICRAESLIFEYMNNRNAFLRWKGEQDG